MDVVNVNDRAVDLFQREIVDPVEQDGTGVQRDVPVELADLFVPGRENEVLRRDGGDDIIGRNIERLHGLLIEIDLTLEDFAAIGGRHRSARDGGELRSNEVLPAIEQLHLRHLFAGKRKLQDRNARGAVAQHVRGRDALRQQFEHRLRGRSHLCERGGDIDVFLKEDLDDAVTVQRRRLEVLDVADLGRNRALVIVDDAAGHVVGQQSVVGPDDGDDRNVDAGEYVGGRRQRGPRAEQSYDDREHDESVGTPEGGEDDPHFDVSYAMCPANSRRERGRSVALLHGDAPTPVKGFRSLPAASESLCLRDWRIAPYRHVTLWRRRGDRQSRKRQSTKFGFNRRARRPSSRHGSSGRPATPPRRTSAATPRRSCRRRAARSRPSCTRPRGPSGTATFPRYLRDVRPGASAPPWKLALDRPRRRSRTASCC